jgi:hypothetical protein
MKVLRTLAIFAVATVLATGAYAQAIYGNIYGKVTDESGAVLPGVSVTLSGIGAPQTATTGSQGEFRFLNLSAGAYTVKTELAGFATVERSNVVVNVGVNTELTIPMKVASVATTITVSGEVPLLDTRRQTSGTNFTQAELKSIPTARDPWVMLQQTPGVLVDRQNVGGSESGQQDNYVGKGTDPSQNAWNVDGVSVTDMAALGSSSTYYDFDAFQEMQMTTGGTDPSVSVPGVTINMVTKRGTNEVHGSARIFDTPNQLEAKPATISGGRAFNKIDHIDDYGVEAGGPLWPDKAWLWGSYGKQQINKIVGTNADGSHNNDKTTLEDFAGKINLQAIESNNFTLFYFRGDKVKLGRNASPSRPQPTTWNQKGPTTIWKGEDSQVFGPNFVASVNYSYEDGGFELVPEGGLNTQVFLDTDGIWHNSFIDVHTKRPQHQANGNLSAFFNTGSLGHELKFGFGYRQNAVKSLSQWPGDGNVAFYDSTVELTRPKNVHERALYYDGFIADTMTMSNLTVNIGVRYDDQKAENFGSSDVANPTFPDLLPAISYSGSHGALIHYKNWEPRVGLTYALGAQKTTLLRASYARFADQLGSGATQFANPLGYQYLYAYFTDTNGNHIADAGELGAIYGFYGDINPNNPSDPLGPNRIDPNLKDTTTDEFMAGIDQQILPEFVAGVTYTYRNRKNFSYTPFLQNVTYTLVNSGETAYDTNHNPIGTTAPFYACSFGSGDCNPIDNPDFTGGRFETNRPGYSTKYQSVELNLTKRLANRWMAHGNFTYTNWKQSKGTCATPNNVLGFNGDTCDNAVVYFGGASNSGSYANVFINAKWAFNVAALYQLPLNFNVGANFYGRQGYVLPFYVRENAQDGVGTQKVIVGSPDDHRNASLFQLDMRAEKVIPLFQKADLTLSMDVFNVLNRHTLLQERIRASGSQTGNSLAGRPFELQNSRILRFGARLSF